MPYIFAYRETKYHGTAEASWQKQFITPGGFTVTPFAGIRVDGADYNGGSALLPGEVSLLTATPIAALDVRWPLIAFNNGNSHLFEPIAQIVYRGSTETLPGITNDNAQSFVLDDTNIFSYNRFSGTDRQETGLRANVGGRYQGNFDERRLGRASRRAVVLPCGLEQPQHRRSDADRAPHRARHAGVVYRPRRARRVHRPRGQHQAAARSQCADVDPAGRGRRAVVEHAAVLSCRRLHLPGRRSR